MPGVPGAAWRLQQSGALERLGLAGLALDAVYVAERLSPTERSTGAAPLVSRLTVTLPTTAPLLGISGGVSRLAISPDGSEIVYVGGTRLVRGGGDGNDSRLYRRSLNRLDVVPIPSTEGASTPFFSADGRALGFFMGGAIQKIGLNGGVPTAIAQPPFPPSRGAAWGRDDVIYYGILGGDLWRVLGAGGPASLVAGPEALQREKEITRRFPSMLPDGASLLYVALPTNATGFASGFNFNAAQIVALDVRTGRRSPLLTGGFLPQYVPSGHVVFARENGLYAAPFDLPSLAIRGDAVKVVDGVRTFSGNGFADFAVSATGTLVYAPGEDTKDYALGTTVVWVDRQGRERPLAHWSNAFNLGRLSPDGTRLLVHGNSAISDVGVHDIARGVLTRLTLSQTGASAPIWSPDGTQATYVKPDPAFAAGPYRIVARPVDGSGVEAVLLERAVPVFPESWSPEGTWLAFTEVTGATGSDIWLVPATGDRIPVALASTAAAEGHPRFSPDGRWIAYQSNESGRDEVFVRPWPGSGGSGYQVSSSGGTNPEWALGGRELVYQQGAAVMHAQVVPGAAFATGPPAKLFERSFGRDGRLLGVAPSGQEFVMAGSGAEPAGPGPTTLVVIQNWGEELKRLVPAR